MFADTPGEDGTPLLKSRVVQPCSNNFQTPCADAMIEKPTLMKHNECPSAFQPCKILLGKRILLLLGKGQSFLRSVTGRL